MTAADLLLVARMRRIGMKMPVRSLQAARGAKLPVPLACSILTQETGGGVNEYGHDPTIFVGAGAVTKGNYHSYLALRNQTGKCQGVGPVQLTYAGYQDAADRAGGCWKPLVNMTVGFGVLVDHIRRDGLKSGVAAYNGTGPAAQRYADEVLARAALYAKALKLPPL